MTVNNGPEKDKISELIADLKHPDYYVRCDAAYELGECQDVRAIMPLLELLKEPKISHPRPAMDSEVKSRASVALAKIGEEAVPALIDALSDIQHDPDGIKRYWIIDALGLAKDKRAIETLIHALKSEHRDVRGAAIVALGRISDLQALKPLISIFKNLQKSDGYLFFAAAEALGCIGGSRSLQVLEEALEHLLPEDGGAYDAVSNAIQRIRTELTS